MLISSIPSTPCHRAYLLVGKEYKERGLGEVKVNRVVIDGKVRGRVLMRADKVRRLVVNEPVFAKTTVEHTPNDRMIRFGTIDATGKTVVYVFKFHAKGEALQFVAAVKELVSSLSPVPTADEGVSTAPTAASAEAATKETTTESTPSTASSAAPAATTATATATEAKEEAAKESTDDVAAAAAAVTTPADASTTTATTDAAPTAAAEDPVPAPAAVVADAAPAAQATDKA